MAGARGSDPSRDLTAQVSFLEEEVAVLRRKLADSPRQVRALEERLADLQANLAGTVGQNDRLVGTLREARDQIVALKEEVERLAQPPSGYGVFLERHDDDDRRRVHRRPQAARHGQPGRRGRGAAPRPGGHAQRGAQRREGAGVREAGRGRPAQGGARGRRARAGGRPDRPGARRHARRLAASAPPHQGGRLAAARVPQRLRLRADPEVRGRGARPRGGPGHRLQRHRRPVRRRSRRSATPSSCRSCTRTCSRSTSCGRRRACCSTARPAAARR